MQVVRGEALKEMMVKLGTRVAVTVFATAAAVGCEPVEATSSSASQAAIGAPNGVRVLGWGFNSPDAMVLSGDHLLVAGSDGWE